MGSTGSGSFSDYPGTGSKGDGSGDSGGGEDRCNRAFSVILQDVEHCQYYANTSSVPPAGTKLSIALQKRLVAVDSSNTTIGNIPTSLNYLADCLSDGFVYEGLVTSSSAGATATVAVDFAPA
jgi:hypothetical protein